MRSPWTLALVRNGRDKLDLFEYILIITSVIFALAVAQILMGASRVAQSSAAFRTFFAHSVWVVVLFAFIFLVWWATWEFRSIDWTFPKYVYMLITPTLLFFACSLIVPANLDGEEVDLEAHFFQIRRPLLWSFLLATIAAFLDGSVLSGEPLCYPSRIGQAIVVGALICGIWTERRILHNAISLIVLSALVMLVLVRFWAPR